MLAFFLSYSSQYQESISSKPWRIFVLLFKSLDQFIPFYALSFQLSWHTPMSFFNVKLIADGHFPRISLSFLSQLLFLFMSVSSPSLNPSGYKSSLSIGSSANMSKVSYFLYNFTVARAVSWLRSTDRELTEIDDKPTDGDLGREGSGREGEGWGRKGPSRCPRGAEAMEEWEPHLDGPRGWPCPRAAPSLLLRPRLGFAQNRTPRPAPSGPKDASCRGPGRGASCLTWVQWQ